MCRVEANAEAGLWWPEFAKQLPHSMSASSGEGSSENLPAVQDWVQNLAQIGRV